MEVKQSWTTSEIIARRMRNSGDEQHADAVVRKGDSPNRTITNVHNSRNQKYGDDVHGVDIHGNKRTVV